MADFTPEELGPQQGERVVFWAWMTIVAVGLSVMLAIPLMGR